MPMTTTGAGVPAITSLAARLTALLGPTASFWLPGPAYWFTDSAKTTPCADTGLIRVWADGSTNGRDLSQATSASRPTARLIGGKWRAVLDGVDDTMAVASYSQASTAHTLGVVASLSANGLFPIAVVSRAAVSELRGAGDTRRPQATTDEGTGAVTDPTALTINTAYRLIASLGATGQPTTLYRDGSAVATDAADTTVNPPNTITIGCRPGPSLFWPGSFAAVVFSPSTLSAGTVTALDALLSEVSF